MKKRILFAWAYIFPLFAWTQIDRPAFQPVGKDSVLTYVSDRYKANSFLRHLLMGKNYRDEWIRPVVLPVLRLSATPFKIEELGGGMQTKSLQLKDNNGKAWALRTLDKDVAGALSSVAENTVAKKIAQDQISAALPYAPLIIGPLAKSAGVLAAQPVIYFVADDPRLGPYRSIFANTVCMLEERDPGFDKTDNTEEVVEKIMKGNTHVVQQKILLRARLFDMIIADWDRHFDNWRWGIRDSAGLKYYHAIPRDRDWAFYHSNGLVPKLARLLVLRFLINFSKEPDHIKSLNYKAHTFDRVFLNSLSGADWKEGIRELQQELTDEEIERAVKQLPPPIYASVGDEIVQKLKSRRDALEDPAMRYYRFLTRHVQVEGSGDEEMFTVDAADGGLRLQIYQMTKNGSKGLKLYDRTFLRSETYRITLNGLGGKDKFVVAENVNTKLRLNINGGEGEDSYQLGGHLRITVHDEDGEANVMANKTRAGIHFR